MYYILLESLEKRTEVITKLKQQGVNPVFHYVPLHSSPAGKKYGLTSGNLPHTDNLADRLLRLPLWIGMDEAQDRVIAQLQAAI
jgi:dTDP-4-amino-4,6-dideoxygalactose transaminase